MTSLKFGTSSLRGLALELVGDETRRYTAAFLRYLSNVGESSAAIYLGRDLRVSSEAIYHDCAAAAAAVGVQVINCGLLAAPALACHAMAAGAPSIMITGSHIPADRNDLKFFRASREISKLDEIGIRVFGCAVAEICGISDLVKALPLRVALSDRLENIASEKSRALLERLSEPPAAAAYFCERGSILRTITIDGLQVFVDDGTMIHYRASGNAPELRRYVEADALAQAQDALSRSLNAARTVTVPA